MSVNLLVFVVTTFIFIFPFRAVVRAVSLVRPVPLFFSLCCTVLVCYGTNEDDR